MNSAQRKARKEKLEASRPHCRQCDKPLAKRVHYLEVPLEATKEDVLRMTVEHKGLKLPILQITRTRVYEWSKHQDVRVWCGFWENRGLFCSQQCGFRWALRLLSDPKNRAQL